MPHLHLLALVLVFAFLALVVVIAGVIIAGHVRMAIWRRRHQRIVSNRWLADHIAERRPWW